MSKELIKTLRVQLHVHAKEMDIHVRCIYEALLEESPEAKSSDIVAHAEKARAALDKVYLDARTLSIIEADEARQNEKFFPSVSRAKTKLPPPLPTHVATPGGLRKQLGWCEECGSPQYMTPSGTSCINGHGGAGTLDKKPT